MLRAQWDLQYMLSALQYHTENMLITPPPTPRPFQGQEIFFILYTKARVSDPDPNPDWIRISSGQWIRIMIQEGKNDPQK